MWRRAEASTQAARSPTAFDGRERVLAAAYAGLPLTFVENRGQADERVRFHAQGAGHAFYLTRDQIALTLQNDSGRGVALGLHFLDADPRVVPVGSRRAPGTVNYLKGDDPAGWRTGVPGYHDVVYRELWPGIDLKLNGQAGELKYEFHVRPGAGRGHPAGLPRRGGPAAGRCRRAAHRHRPGRAA